MALDPKEWLINLFGKKEGALHPADRGVSALGAPDPNAPPKLAMSAMQMAGALVSTRDFLAGRREAVAGVGWTRVQRMPDWTGEVATRPSEILARATWSGVSDLSGAEWSTMRRAPRTAMAVTDFVRRRERLYRYYPAGSVPSPAQMSWPEVGVATEENVPGAWDSSPANAVIQRLLQEVWGRGEPADLPVSARRRKMVGRAPAPLLQKRAAGPVLSESPAVTEGVVRRAKAPAERVAPPEAEKGRSAAAVEAEHPIKRTWHRFVASLQKGKKGVQREAARPQKRESVPRQSAPVAPTAFPTGRKERDLVESRLSGSEQEAAARPVHPDAGTIAEGRSGEQTPLSVPRQQSKPGIARAVPPQLEVKSGPDARTDTVVAKKRKVRKVAGPGETALAQSEVTALSRKKAAVEKPLVAPKVGDVDIARTIAPSRTGPVSQNMTVSPQRKSASPKTPSPWREAKETIDFTGEAVVAKTVLSSEALPLKHETAALAQRNVNAAEMLLVGQKAGQEAVVAARGSTGIELVSPTVAERVRRPVGKVWSDDVASVTSTLQRAVDAKAAWGRNVAEKYGATHPLAAENAKREWPDFVATETGADGGAISAPLLRNPTSGAVAGTIQRVRTTLSPAMPVMPLVAPDTLQRENSPSLSRESAGETAGTPLPGTASTEASAESAGVETAVASGEKAEEPSWPDMESLTDEIFRRLSWRLRLERERRGF